MGSLRNFLQKTFNLVLRASTKITTIFFFAITATVAGGLFTFFTHDAPTPEGYDERVPASVQEGGRGKKLPNLLAGTGGGTFLPSGGGAGGMPLNYDERANNQGNGNFSGGEQIDPANANLSSAASIAQSAQQRALAEMQNQQKSAEASRSAPRTSTATGTSTSTSTETATGDGSAAYGSSATTTSTATATTTSGPRYLNLTAGDSAAPGLCVALTLTLYDASIVATAAGSATGVFLSTTAGAIYSDSACVTAASSVTVAAGSSSGTAYFKATAAASATITAQHDTLGSSSVTISVAQPTASLVLGQASFTASGANNGGLSASSLSNPYQVLRVGTKLLAADSDNHRILIWNTVPTSSNQAADLVLGQPNLTSNAANNGGIGANTLNNPEYLATDGTRLFVSDRGNNRVLVWSTIPTTTQQAADLVLGQPDFVSNTANNGGIGAATLNGPEGISTDGTRLVICDAINNRVLIWSSIPTASQQAADIVLGQADFTSNTANAGGAVSANGFEEPYDVVISSSRLFVADSSNARVLGYLSLPTANGAAADFVLGQPGFTTNTADNGGVSAASMNTPGGLAADSAGRLYVADYGSSRVQVWNSLPSSSFASADAVYGQSGLTGNTANSGGLSASSLNGPVSVTVFGSELWISDNQNHRVLLHELP